MYFNGKNGANAERLIYVNGSNYNVTTYSIGSGVTTQPSFRKTASGITLIAAPLPTSSAEKAVYKINCSTLSGIEDNLSNQILFNVFPNPNNGQITIKLSNKIGNCKLTVLNLLGEMVYSEIINEQTTMLNLNLKTGFYFVSIDNKGQKTTRKIVVE